MHRAPSARPGPRRCLRARGARPSASEPGSGPPSGFARWGEGTGSPRTISCWHGSWLHEPAMRTRRLPKIDGVATPKVLDALRSQLLLRRKELARRVQTAEEGLDDLDHSTPVEAEEEAQEN